MEASRRRQQQQQQQQPQPAPPQGQEQPQQEQPAQQAQRPPLGPLPAYVGSISGSRGNMRQFLGSSMLYCHTIVTTGLAVALLHLTLFFNMLVERRGKKVLSQANFTRKLGLLRGAVGKALTLLGGADGVPPASGDAATMEAGSLLELAEGLHPMVAGLAEGSSPAAAAARGHTEENARVGFTKQGRAVDRKNENTQPRLGPKSFPTDLFTAAGNAAAQRYPGSVASEDCCVYSTCWSASTLPSRSWCRRSSPTRTCGCPSRWSWRRC